MSDCCLTPNEQYEELGISKNSGKPYKNTNFDKEDILANHKSFMSSLNIPINEENCEYLLYINSLTGFKLHKGCSWALCILFIHNVQGHFKLIFAVLCLNTLY